MIKGFYIIKSGIAELQTPSGKLDSTLVEGGNNNFIILT